jgi:glucose-1-phosphate adenylyltransferase
MANVLTLILGGGRGTRLFPLTGVRSKPAVPIGGSYRLIDIPISNCLHADLRRMFVLTQFNSASLNRHIALTYRLDLFSPGFVEILAAELTPESSDWFQGTADAVRRAMRHFVQYSADYYLILAGDHLYRMDFRDLVTSHIDSGADITIAAQPVHLDEASDMGIFRFDAHGHIVGFEEKPSRERLAALTSGVPAGSDGPAGTAERPFVASMGIYLFSRRSLISTLERHDGVDFGREIIPQALGSQRVRAYLFDGYWADVGTVESFYRANLMLTRPGAPFKFHDPTRPIFTHPRFLAGSRLLDCHVRNAIVAEGCYLEQCTVEESIVGIRSRISRGCRIARSVLLGADGYASSDASAHTTPLGIGRDVVLDGVIVDKNARIGEGTRLTNDAGVQTADGEGYYVRGGIVIVPKGAVVQPGTVA